MIYYFSATGNSKHVANRLKKALKEQSCSVLEVLNGEVKIGENEQMLLVYPNYCGGVPSVIRDFLQKARFDIAKSAKLILVVTYGNNTGASGAIATKYFKKNTKRTFDAMYSVKMPDSWTPVFDLTDQTMVEEINRKADEEIDIIIDKIKRGLSGDHINDKLGKKMEAIYSVFYKILSQTKHLHVSGKCIGCGLCESNCPVNAIELKSSKPIWTKKNCAMCLECLHRCPAFAIDYDSKTQNHGQYLHPDEKIE